MALVVIYASRTRGCTTVCFG